ncbi:S-layer homology domain-containing protein [Paenibacillus sp. PL2-23]|uniref:S-layer homology domain-containing protein n=1 Tax=Paenibacillus sp. PL2-23 TaxID=2100729 RepID=UPI0030F71149
MKHVLTCIVILAMVVTGLIPVHPAQASANESLVIYPAPGDGVKESPKYKVFVEQSNRREASFVYFSEPPVFDPNDPKSGNKNDGAEIYRAAGTTQNWTTFSLEGTATVEVQKLDGKPIESVRILPSKYGIEGIISEDRQSVRFEIKSTQKAFVEFDGELIDRMFVFADPLEEPDIVPEKTNGDVFVAKSSGGALEGLNETHKVLFFEPGVYDIESYGPINTGTTIEDRTGSHKAWIVPSHIEQIYIEGGAVVFGGFLINHNNVVVNGRGVISGETLLYHQMNLLEFNAGTENGYVEGITMSDGVHFSLRGYNARYNGANFKVIANWRFNNDGINVPQDALIENVYLSGNDDTVKFYFGGSTLKDSVIGQMVNGAVFQFGWFHKDVANVNVSNIDVLFFDGFNANQNLGVINYRPRGNKDDKVYAIENITFDGIRVEGPTIRFISLGIPQNQAFKNITIRNVDIHSWRNPTIKNYIKGSTDASSTGMGEVQNIRFDNVKVNGMYMTKENMETIGNFEPLDNKFNNEVHFEVSVDKTELETKMNVVKALMESNYTQSSWSAMQAVYNHAREVYYSTESTEIDTNSATEALQHALDALIPNITVTLNKTTSSLVVGSSESLTATIAPDVATDKSVMWSVSNSDPEGVVTVDNNGLVTALKAGTAIIRATSNADTTKYAEHSITVSYPVGGHEGNGSGGGNSSGTIPSNDHPLKVEITAPQLNPNTGTAEVKITSEKLKKVLETSNLAVVEIPKVMGAVSYEVNLTASDLKAGDDKKIEIIADIGTVTVPTNMLSHWSIEGSKNISISIASVDASKLNHAFREQLGDKPVLEFHMKADGEIIEWKNKEAPVRISIPYAPTEKERKYPEHIVIWYIDRSGQITPIPNGKFNSESGSVDFTTTHFSTYAVAFVQKTFQDLTGHEWARKAIEVNASKGIVQGISDSSFAPAASIKRGDFMLLLMKTLDLSGDAIDNFSDVSLSSYYYEAIGTARSLGITEGKGDNLFDPEAFITRQEMMTLVFKGMKAANKGLISGTASELESYADYETIASYAKESIATLTKNGIVSGNGTDINPLGYATRAESAVLIYNMNNQ